MFLKKFQFFSRHLILSKYFQEILSKEKHSKFYLFFPEWFNVHKAHCLLPVLKKIKQRNYRTQRKFPKWVFRLDFNCAKWIVCYFFVEFKDFLPKISTFRSYNMIVFFLILPILDLWFSSEFFTIPKPKLNSGMVGRAREIRQCQCWLNKWAFLCFTKSHQSNLNSEISWLPRKRDPQSMLSLHHSYDF